MSLRWRLKAVVVLVFKVLPFMEALLYYKLQRHFGKKMNENAMLRRLRVLNPIIQTLNNRALIHGQDICEIGSGRYPLFPVLFSQMGANSITTCDLNEYMVPELIEPVEKAVNSFRASYGLTVTEIEPTISLERLGQRRINYLAPLDFQDAPFEDNNFDLLFSNAVFEHIPQVIIERIHKESFRVLKPGGHVFHNIDLTDHFSHSDPTISKLRFLKYSDRFWHFLVGGTFFYQNRIRVSQHIKSIEAAGFVIVDIQKNYIEESSIYFVHDDVRRQCSGDDSKVTQVSILAKKPIG